jgi:threonine/homoserine/homoserine lactone efflux protein
MLPYLILGATYAFAAAVQPGQLQAYLISQSLANGWRRTLPAAFAPILSDAPIVTLVLLVLTRVPPSFVYMLQLAGGVFILYLAAGAFKAWRDDRGATAASAAPAHQTLIKAAIVNLLNPNPYLGWTLVLGPLVLRAWRQSPTNAVALVVAFYATLVVATAGIIILFAAARSFGPRVARQLVGISALALAAFGLYQLWSGGTAVLQRL